MKNKHIFAILIIAMLFSFGVFCFAENNQDVETTQAVETTEYIRCMRSSDFPDYKNLEKMTIPDNVLGLVGFKRLENLKEVEVLGNSLKKIGTFAFFCSKNLEKFNFPDSLKLIDYEAFYKTGLKSIRIPSKCRLDFEVFGHSGLKRVVFENRTDKNESFLGKCSFAYCNNLKKVYLPKVSEKYIITQSTFGSCKNLQYVYRTDNVKQIDRRAFGDCSSLRSFTLPECIESVDKTAFKGCNGLKKFKILATSTDFLEIKDGSLFLKYLPAKCKVYVKTEEIQKLVENSGFKGTVVLKPDMG